MGAGENLEISSVLLVSLCENAVRQRRSMRVFYKYRSSGEDRQARLRMAAGVSFEPNNLRRH
jgi:hypothetical protein